MLRSTAEYLDLLRKGNLLTALEWVSFLQHHYGKNNQLAADSIIPLAIYELVNHGVSQQDLIPIVILHDLINTEPFLLPGEEAYAATILTNAAMQCLVYDDLKLLNNYRPQPPLTQVKDIEALIVNDVETLTASVNSSLLNKKSAQLLALAKQDPYCKKIQAARERLSQVALCQDYIAEISEHTGKAFALRGGIALALRDKLIKGPMDGEDEAEIMKDHIDSIRKKNPESWEEEKYLVKLSPKGAMETLVENTSHSLRFFVGKWLYRVTAPETELPKDSDHTAQV